MVKALLDCGEARFDHRLKFEVGEDIWQILFNAFAHEFTDIACQSAFKFDPVSASKAEEQPVEVAAALELTSFEPFRMYSVLCDMLLQNGDIRN